MRSRRLPWSRPATKVAGAVAHARAGAAIAILVARHALAAAGGHRTARHAVDSNCARPRAALRVRHAPISGLPAARMAGDVARWCGDANAGALGVEATRPRAAIGVGDTHFADDAACVEERATGAPARRCATSSTAVGGGRAGLARGPTHALRDTRANARIAAIATAIGIAGTAFVRRSAGRTGCALARRTGRTCK
jgi:hypothetical protein